MKQKSLKFVFPLSLLVLGLVWIFVSITDLGIYGSEPKAGFFPLIMAVIMIIIAAIDLMYTFKIGKSTFSYMQFLPIIGLFGVIACSYLLGTIPSLGIFLLLWMRVFEKYSWKVTLITTSITLLFIWGVFDVFVSVNFQTGLLWKLLM